MLDELIQTIPAVINGLAVGIILPLGIYAWGYISSAIHEIAHGIAAWCLGLNPRSINIGHGERVVFSTTIRNIVVNVYNKPYGGMTYFQAPKPGMRWKGVGVLLVGILAEIFLLGGLILCDMIIVILSATISSHFMVFFPLGLIVLIYQAIHVLVNLVPSDSSYNGHIFPNDMKQLLRYLTGAYDRQLTQAITLYKTALLRYDSTVGELEPWFLTADMVTGLQYVEALEHLREARYDQGVTQLQEILQSDLLSPIERAFHLDMLTSIVTLHGKQEFLQDALAWVEEACELTPHAKTLQATHGMLFIEDGQYMQGISLLEPVLSENSLEHESSLAACYLAKAYHKLGDNERARFWLNQVQSTEGIERLYQEITNSVYPKEV